MSNKERRLPVVENPTNEEERPSCSPTIYVSNEEAAMFAIMRGLREKSLDLRQRLESAEADERAGLESELQELRAQHRKASQRREQAYTRKMIMLGHLPPNYPVE